MHRQSLGSPSSKLHGIAVAKEDAVVVAADDETPKALRLSSPPPRPPNKFVHLIPLLTLLCFLILYLCSHTPSSSDLNHFAGFKRFSKHHDIDSAAEIGGDIEHYTEARRGDVLAIRSLRNLKQMPKNRLHRKLADF